MSKYSEFQTTLKDEAVLVEALKQMGYPVECHAEPQTLYDWHGRPRPEKAQIIIRRKDTGIGASNDIGFVRQGDGSFGAVISEYDRGAKFNDSWLGSLKQNYQEQKTRSVAEARGYIFQGREVVKTATGTAVKLRFMVR